MEKLTFRELIDEQEESLFLDKVENYTNVRLPLDYARRSKIVGVFLQEKMVGGYMLVTKPNFRSLMFVPSDVKKASRFFQKDPFEMMEVNGLWIGPAVRSPRAQFLVWLHLIKDIFLAKKKYLLLMSNNCNENIKNIHGLTDPELVYEGSPQLLGGENTHNQIRVGYTTRWKLVSNFPKYIQAYRARERKAIRVSPVNTPSLVEARMQA